MAFTSSFFDSYNTEKNNIRKRRKENAEMFEAYKDAKVKDGEEVSVEELTQMKTSLAGGDFYFGQSLPAESMMSELADRTNKRVTNTISDEFVQAAEGVTKVSKVVEDMIPMMVNIDDAEGVVGKEKIKSIFLNANPNDKEMGLNLFKAWESRIPKMISNSRDKEVNDFMLKHPTANLYSEVKHLTTGLPSWKISGITEAFKSKEMVFDNKNFSDALKNADVKIQKKDLEFMDATELELYAQEYLLAQGVLKKDITPDRIAAALAALKPIWKRQVTVLDKENENNFEAAVAKDKVFLTLLSKPAVDNRENLENHINKVRADNDLKPFDGKEMDTFLTSYEATGLSVALTVYEQKKASTAKIADTNFKAAIVTTENLFKNWAGALKDNDEKLQLVAIAQSIHNSHHIPSVKMPYVLSLIEKMEAENESSDQADRAKVIQSVIGQLGLSTRDKALLDYQKSAMKSSGAGVRPNTKTGDYIENALKPFRLDISRAVAIIQATAMNSTATGGGQTSLGMSVEKLKEKTLKQIQTFYKEVPKRIVLHENLLDDDKSQDWELLLQKEMGAALSSLNNAHPQGKPSYFIKLRNGIYTTVNNSNYPLPPSIKAGVYRLDPNTGQYVFHPPPLYRNNAAGGFSGSRSGGAFVNNSQTSGGTGWIKSLQPIPRNP